MQQNWQGVYPAISTQFHADGSINYAANATMLQQLIADGIDGIIALGTVGENASLTATEKREFLQQTVKTVAGRIPVIAGCTEHSAAQAIDYIKAAEQIGVDGIMLLPAVVYRGTDREVLVHYQTVARATRLPIMIYNNPVSYGVDINLEMTALLAEEPNIVAIKESTTDTRRITELQSRFGDRFQIFCGVDDIALESVLLGATGWISGLTNVFPRESVMLFKLARAGRIKEAREIYRWFMPLLRLDTIPTLVQCIKLAEQLLGRGSENVRLPRLALQGSERDYVEQVVAQALRSRPDLTSYQALLAE
ncbi:MAG: 4-hydroxy-tetrahydrodipicolinate synthase [Gammaproteobacteria bacterium]|uniref:4-hydroxy-tetrahydrodipicolinate synthase n=1 Tax=Rheinheimera pleomorphica TaxID=2703963 RepID=UPI001420343D|nr:4-hydroxy-tetrahydrodipicolinate synthase [Rheinheimera pleomorphica]MBU1310425.1 4-hydroxy-tetrahydrodipicolinate synthase [Gammaproteobacteria bacterium]MBU1555631.1 4-hydroxy-tetrahydrodipicolinate synthase [Gammaproteobacteria bacterium]MBU2069887.1 4-hydroxy-tetrahydrodipicolinate synthase [Gammaproteobacteria bacterium]MBU2184831.1 4-hydroxy-tetrahydrodipicolinate synthase [Gammaproteobacteria bacterium]MBU2204367.1 4-hydroxy-tetrahydrodipicolinate synthase [Gammaproteobacteria bacter